MKNNRSAYTRTKLFQRCASSAIIALVGALGALVLGGVLDALPAQATEQSSEQFQAAQVSQKLPGGLSLDELNARAYMGSSLREGSDIQDGVKDTDCNREQNADENATHNINQMSGQNDGQNAGQNQNQDQGINHNPAEDNNLTYSSHSTWYTDCGKDWYYVEANDGSSKQAVQVPNTQSIGIDVSEHNHTIDWQAVKSAGISWAIIRCGYGNYRNCWDSSIDKCFIQNVQGARAAGIPFGVYLYSYSDLTPDGDSFFNGTSEGEQTLYYLNKAGIAPGDLALPIFYDLEESSAKFSGGFSVEALNGKAEDFACALGTHGFPVGMYANLNWWKTRLTGPAFQQHSWLKWVAMYPVSPTYTSTGYPNTALWQFTSAGHVPGCSTNIDMSFNYNPLYTGMKPDYAALGEWIWTDQGWRYHLDDGDCFAANRWLLIDSNWYWFTEAGYMFTGWHWDNGYNSWFYLKPSGAMASGDWEWIDNAWYGFWHNGTMCKGWTWDSSYNNWFYCYDNGVMATGLWAWIGDAWYGFENNGEMTRGWSWSNAYNAWYYLDPSSGRMLTNAWRKVGHSWYYFYGDGKMARNTWVGSYYVNDSGAWV